jgi:peptidase M1-like protein
MEGDMKWHNGGPVSAGGLGAAAIVLLASPGLAQETIGTPATDYAERYAEVIKLRATSTVAEVKGLTLTRDVARLTLEQGRLYLLSPIGGRVMGVAFEGQGTFRFTPPTETERRRLLLYRKTSSLEEPFDHAVFLFADSTWEELQARLTFATGGPPSVAHLLDECLDYLGDKKQQALDPDVMRPLLNAERTGMFYAHLDRENHTPLMLFINPHEIEGVQLLGQARRVTFLRFGEVLTQFSRQGDPAAVNPRRDRRPEGRISRYVMQVRLPQNGIGELNFNTTADLTITADTAVGPWVPFLLYDELQADSARWVGGDQATIFKGDKSSQLWVRLERPLEAGQSRELRLWYHGNLLDRFGEWFFIKSSISWYPVSMEGRSYATFDLTFESPEGFTLASVGQRTDSASLPGHMVRTRWVTDKPIRNASFNIGIFEQYQLREAGVPPVTVLWSDQMHREIAQWASRTGNTEALAGKNMKQQVASDVAAALQFYQHVYGDAPVAQFYATEIPDLHGEAWPGIVGLSYVTFHQTSSGGEDEAFRAHEVGHQWWGIAVDYATYHDRWMSEGFSDFSGIWFLQTRRKQNNQYFDTLHRWKSDILTRRDAPLPISLGHRVTTATSGEDYSILVYEKGAWILHMLRILMLDLKTMSEDRFTAGMREFYQTYKGGRASTLDFQRQMEKSSNADLSWFFGQWVYGTDIPTYKWAWRADPADGGKYKVRLRVVSERVPPSFLAYVPVTIDLGGDQVARLRVRVTGDTTAVELPVTLPAGPKGVKFNDLDGVLADTKEVTW